MNEEKSQQAATLTEFTWLGHKFPVNNAKTRVSILKGWTLILLIASFIPLLIFENAIHLFYHGRDISYNGIQ